MDKKINNHFCLKCKKKSEFVKVVQRETHYYSVNLETNQWKDFHGDENVNSQELLCFHCNKKLDFFEQERLVY
jgi:hypothetical protein